MSHLASHAGKLAIGILELIYPPACQLCGKPTSPGSGKPFCDHCRLQLQQLLGDKCPRCAAPYPGITANAVNCPHCHDEDYVFTRAMAWGSYQSVLHDIILEIKQQTNESLAHHIGVTFARHFKDEFSTWPIDAIVPVPLHWTRRLWRGYNQAETLARAIARQLSKPCHSNWLWRRLRTPHQASLTPTQRRKNLRQAITSRIPRRYQGIRVLLIDDVMTTGATADACARALLAAGAGAVSVAVLARAVGTTGSPRATASL